MFLKLLPLLAATLLLGEIPQNYKSQENLFWQYKHNQESSFENYKKEQEKALQEYKDELKNYWQDPKLTTQKEWISYTQDQKTRTDVDFEKEKITIETLASSEEEAKQKLQTALAKAVTIDTKTAHDTDPLQQKLKQLQKPLEMVDAKPDSKPILKNIVFQKQPTKKDVAVYVQEKTKKIETKKSPLHKEKQIYFVEVQLPKNTTYKRSQDYFLEVRKNAIKEDIALNLIFAIIHSESAYNPMARSYVPAYGLMQIVPKTAGIDAYEYLYNEKKLVSGDYLYNSKNNIRMGSAYLHILYYRYLRKIKDPQSRLYCTIAAYNTGAGNVAYAFTKTYNINNASKIINRLTPAQVYARLLKDLRYEEPKNYLKRVNERMKIYERIYKQS